MSQDGDGEDWLPETVEIPIEDSIDLHWFRPSEIRDVVEGYLEAARERGFREVRIVHGRGRGVQRDRVQRLLARSPLVERFCDAPGDRGGWGATLAWLCPPEAPATASGSLGAVLHDTLDRYFDALRRHDWPALAACLAEDVHRTGPYLDEVRGREAYVRFLAGLLPSLRGYELRVSGVQAVGERAAWVRLSETLEVRGRRTEFPEALYFELDAAGRIRRVDVYIKPVAPADP